MTAAMTAYIKRDASKADSLRAYAATGAPCFVKPDAFVALVEELGDPQAAIDLLHGLANSAGRPVGVAIPMPDGLIYACFIRPQSRTQERLQGWVAGTWSESIEQELGPIVWRDTAGTRAERRRRAREEARRGRSTSN